MSCVEGAVAAQVPGPNQYWEHIKSKDRAYFIGRDPDGRMVWQCEGDCIEVGNLDWSGWRHIPGCTGWEWEPDQVEEYPQYWTTLATPSSSIAYIKRIDQSTLVSVCNDGTEVKDSVIEWKTDRRTRLTEQEALALLDKPDKRAEVAQNTIERIKRFDPASVPVQEPAEVWPKYYVCNIYSPGYYRCDSEYEVWHIEPNATEKQHTPASTLRNKAIWREVTEAEAKARVTKTIEPALSIEFVPVAPEMDWVVQDRVPARNNIDEWYWCNRGSSPGHFYSGFGGWSSTIMHGHVDGDEVLHLRCRRKDLPDMPPEMEWVDLPQYHVLRKDVDWVSILGAWEPVLGLAGKSVQDLPLRFARCRRKDLPVVEPEEDWVELPQNHVLRKGVDVVYLGAIEQWEVVDGLAGDMVSETSSKRARCLRKDVPKIESPEDWVTQDRVDARPGIDQGWWSYAEPNVDKSKWSWWPIAYSGSAIGRKHGHVHEDGQMLNLRCKRKDLPPVPAPVEETYPQWYILKDDEKRSWVPDWTVKRTGEDTAIRYARDEAGQLYATDEPWTGAPDCWERCSDAEAIVRMGTLMFPRVPSEHRRVPVKLWVTYRLNDEGGDWPVRATQADQTCQNWKEIKFDGNGAFIEVEQ